MSEENPPAPPEPTAPPPAPLAPPAPTEPAAPEPLTLAQVEQAIESRVAGIGDVVRDAVSDLNQPSTPSNAGAGATAPAPPARPKDPRSWLQRVWFGPLRLH